jgi:hypothetical protein
MTSAQGEACASGLDFFESADSSFARAFERAGALRRFVAVGSQVVCLEFAGEALVPLLFPALDHLSVDPVERPALTVHLFDTETTGTPMPRAPWGRDAYGARGEIAGFNDGRIRTVYQPGTDALNLYDRQRRLGLYWIRGPGDVAYWETGAPLRSMFHWWLEDGDLQFVHAGAVGYSTGGVLLAGPGGSGKSTSTLACLDSDLLYAGDDYVVVSITEPARVHSVYQTAKLDPGNLDRVPHLRPLVHNPDRLNSEKAVIFPGRRYPDRITRGFPIKALLVPRVTGRVDSRLVPSRAGIGLSALAPTTVFQLPGDSTRIFSKIAALVRKVPTFILEAGTDLAQIPAVIGRFLRERA